MTRISGHASTLKRLKRGTLSAARATGVLHFTSRTSWRSRRLLILGYHGVSTADEHLWDPELYIPPELLRARFSMLRDGGYTVLPLGEAITRLYDGSLPSRAVALTFDDGSVDFHSVALPLLEEFGFPATVYLTSYYCLHQRPVFTTGLRYILWKCRDKTFDTTGLTANGKPFRLAKAGDREQAFLSVRNQCTRRGLTGRDKDDVMVETARRLGFDYNDLLRRRLLHLMSPDEVAALPQELVGVQLHTHRHRVPADAAFEEEIVENRTIIANLTSARAATHFCYPSGMTHPTFPERLGRLGVKSATTCFPGLASARSNAFLLPRFIDTVATSPIEFESWLSGVSTLLPRRAIRANG
jgi:polysaccharide deacetylase